MEYNPIMTVIVETWNKKIKIKQLTYEDILNGVTYSFRKDLYDSFQNIEIPYDVAIRIAVLYRNISEGSTEIGKKIRKDMLEMYPD